MADNLLSRFLRYVQIDTQSSEDKPTIPSTPGQWDLLRLLESELKDLGAPDVTLTEKGYVLATVPATTDNPRVPVVAFMAHVDTAHEFSGHGVRPLVHRQWDGKPIHLPHDVTQVLDPAVHPDLLTAVGKDLVTASGKTLLGADDKAGVAIVMTLAQNRDPSFLACQPSLPKWPSAADRRSSSRGSALRFSSPG